MVSSLHRFRGVLVLNYLCYTIVQLTGCSGNNPASDDITGNITEAEIDTSGLAKSEELDSLANTFGKSNILLAFYHDSIIVALHSKLGVEQRLKSATEIDSEIIYKTDSMYSLINGILLNQSKYKTLILREVEDWCAVKMLLDEIPAFCRSEVFFEQVVYSNQYTQHLFKKYLVAEGQYWGSLSIDASFDLYYRTIDFLAHSQLEVRRKFLSDFTEHYCNPPLPRE